jgi:hypothetical protein
MSDCTYRHYEKTCKDEQSDAEKNKNAMQIKNEYIDDNAQFYIQLDPDVKAAIDRKFTQIS